MFYRNTANDTKLLKITESSCTLAVDRTIQEFSYIQEDVKFFLLLIIQTATGVCLRHTKANDVCGRRKRN